MNLTPFLEDIERRIRPEDERRIYDAWKNFACRENPKNRPFAPPYRTPIASDIDWKHININDAVEDTDLMILSQLENCHNALKYGGNTVLMMRANYGVGIVPSMYGSKKFIMPYQTDTLPNVYPLEGEEEAVRRIVDEPVPSILNGFGKQVFEIAERYAEIRRKYPKIAQFVRFDHPDTQGPFDICELLLGSGIFYALYDEPDLIKNLLEHASETIILVNRKWREILPDEDGMACYFGKLTKGAITIRNDSAMNLSPAFYREFIRPYDEKVFEALGGGAIHFCGKGDHFISLLSETKKLYSVDISQPHLNDMALILSSVIGKGLNLFVPKGDYSKEGLDESGIFYL